MLSGVKQFAHEWDGQPFLPGLVNTWRDPPWWANRATTSPVSVINSTIAVRPFWTGHKRQQVVLVDLYDELLEDLNDCVVLPRRR
jgi:hypothetical protein